MGLIVLVIGAWTFDPMVWLVYWRFPSAKVKSYYEYGWLVPGLLHTYIRPNDLYDGTYLDIEIWDSTVDLNRLRGIPFSWVRLHRCKVSDLSLLREMDILELNREVSFFDCDLSAVPPEQFLGFGPYDGRSPRLFYGAPRDPKHFSFDKAP